MGASHSALTSLTTETLVLAPLAAGVLVWIERTGRGHFAENPPWQGLLLASADIVYVIYQKLKEPPYWLIDVTTLFDVFSLVLIIAIGYELIKSLILVISSESIPSFPIIQIAIIAVANKIITLDIKHTDAVTLFGLAALLAALGAAS